MAYFDNILKRAREKQLKEGISYPQKDGKLYNTFKWFYILSVIYQSLWSLIIVLTPLVLLGEWEISKGVIDLGNKGIYLKDYITITTCFCLLILSLFMLKFNHNMFAASFLGCVNSSAIIAMIFALKSFFKNDAVTNREPAIYYYGYLIPLLIALICVIGMVVIVITAYFKTQKAYNKVLEIVYEQYNSLNDSNKPEWEEYVKNYKF